jgi:sulfane dehydrogenase subunit SoxC
MTYNDYGHLQKDPKVIALTSQIGPKSVITFPGGGHQLKGPGYYEISGLAWSGGGAVKKVDISTDGGKTWKVAEFRTPAFRMAHTRFALPWTWDGKECDIMSRCTDELGTVQPTRAQVAKFWNEPLTPQFNVKGADNTIQVWRIKNDGSVINANFI